MLTFCFRFYKNHEEYSCQNVEFYIRVVNLLLTTKILQAGRILVSGDSSGVVAVWQEEDDSLVPLHRDSKLSNQRRLSS